MASSHDREGTRPSSSDELLSRLRAHRSREAPRYRLAGEIGRGGMGAILRVWDDDLRRPLAMKVVLGEHEPDPSSAGDAAGPESPSQIRDDGAVPSAIDPQRLARFLEEAQITGQLEHPGIVPVHELGLDDSGRAYFTMQLVRGRHLGDVFAQVDRGEDGWTVTRAVGVLLRVCEAMAFAHDRDVIHRDLKPDNVMVGPFGEVFVMDWGLARILGESDPHDARLRADSGERVESDRRADDSDSNLYTMAGDVLGTPAYMPPEQARGEVETMDGRADVYAVGAILYQLLAGHAPYASAGPRPGVRVLLDLLKGPPEPLDTASKGRAAPVELVAIADKAMAREVEARYPTMLALADDLRAYLENRVVAAYETGAWAEARKWVRRNRAFASAVAAAALLLVAGLAVSLLLKAEAERFATLAEGRRVAAEESRELAEQSRVEAENNHERAEREAAVAHAVNEFLNDDVLSSLAPEHLGTDVTVEQMLDHAALRLDWTFTDQPAVESALRLTVGRSYMRLGKPARAASHFARAVALRRRDLGPDAVDTLEARLELASVRAKTGDFGAAEAEYRAVRETMVAQHGRDHPGRLAADNNLAFMLHEAGRLDEARRAYESLLAEQESGMGGQDGETLTTRMNLGVLLTDLGEYDRAGELLEAVLEDAERLLGRRHPTTLDAHNNLARLRAEQGQLDEAERLAQAVMADRAELFGEKHPSYARALDGLAFVRRELGRVREAARDHERSFELLRASVGEDHAWTLNAAENLATAWTETGRYERALELRERTLERLRATLGGDHIQTQTCMSNLASLYNSLGRSDEAATLGREAYAIRERVLGADHPDTLLTLENLGGALFRLGQLAESAELTERVYEGRKRAFGEDHAMVTRTMVNLATLADARGETERAEAMYVEALRRNRRDLGAEHPRNADILPHLGHYANERGEFEEAERYYREALKIRRAVYPEDAAQCTVLLHSLGMVFFRKEDWESAERELRVAWDLRRRRRGGDPSHTVATGFVLGAVLRRLERYEEAEPKLVAYEQAMRAEHGEEHEAYQQAVRALVALYESWQREEEAAAWRAKLQ